MQPFTKETNFSLQTVPILIQHAALSFGSKTSVSFTKVFSALYNPPASTTRISGGLETDSPTVSAHGIHCQTLRTLKLVKFLLR